METETKAKSNIWLTLCKDWILLVFLSLLGFIWEQVFVLITMHEVAESGFLDLPICPIYGFTILAFFYLMGTPHKGGGLLKRVKSLGWRYVLYAMIAFTVPTLIELGVGAFFYELWEVRLWDYSAHPLNIGGYVSVPISLAWTVALTLFMRLLFLPMRNFFQSTKNKPAVIITVISAAWALVDFTYNIILLIIR